MCYFTLVWGLLWEKRNWQMAKIAKDKTFISTLTQQLITLSLPAIFLQALGRGGARNFPTGG